MRKLIYSFLLVLTSASAFSQWAQHNNGITDLSNGVRFIYGSGSRIFTGTVAGFTMYASDDYGDNWFLIPTPAFSGVPVCAHNFNNRMFIGLSNIAWDDVYYTDDNGASWTVTSGGPMTTSVRGFVSDSSNIYCYTPNQGVYRSVNGGNNWARIDTGLTNLNVSCMETIGNRIVLTTIGAGVFISDDKGNNWSASNTGISTGNYAGYRIWRQGTDLYYVDQTMASYVSTDQGSTWNSYTKPAFWGIGPQFIFRSQETGHLYMKNRYGATDSLYRSDDEGLTWTNLTFNLPQGFNESMVYEKNGFVFYGYDILMPNQGIYRSGSFNDLPERGDYTIGVYPNPAAELVQITATTPLRLLELFDGNGQKILQQELYSEKETTFNLSGLNAGIYLIRTYADNGEQSTRRVIKVD